MAITVSEAATLVEEQLNIQTGSEVPPTSVHLADYVRRAARRLISEARPVYVTSSAMTALALTVTDKAMIYHAAVNNVVLLQTEWMETATGIQVTGYEHAKATDTISVWYSKGNAIADGAATIDLDTIHGDDWGYEYLVTYASMLAEERLSNTDMANAMVHLQRYRTLERSMEQQMAALRQARDFDLSILGNRQQQRMQFGPGYWRASTLGGFLNDSNLIDRTAGEN